VDSGELLTRWTVRAAVVLYALGLAHRASARGHKHWLGWARLAWTLGFAAFLLHVACAFHFYHHWSHAAAYEATARQTADVTGLAWGGGLYANYLFALIWGADACWWWGAPAVYAARPRWLEWAVQGFLAFIAFNATVVFAAGPVRWLGLATALLLAVGLVWGASRPSGFSRASCTGTWAPGDTAGPPRGIL
jgi:hypothetical protein